ncbi:hypothetical protein F898_02641 [Acinetobacter courvalinii]|nr:hypothetical protein F898_02641 [Acinetobacter courvalinii]
MKKNTLTLSILAINACLTSSLSYAEGLENTLKSEVLVLDSAASEPVPIASESKLEKQDLPEVNEPRTSSSLTQEITTNIKENLLNNQKKEQSKNDNALKNLELNSINKPLSAKEKTEGYWQSIQLPLLTVDEYRKKREQKRTIDNLNTVTTTKSASKPQTSTLRIGGDNSPLSPASIAEMARALQYDVDNIYEYVKNNIEYTPGFEGNRGALGALLDNQGNSADQSTLMVELLRTSGYEANYVDGLITLNAQQLKDLFGFSAANTCSLTSFFSATQIPLDKINNAPPPAAGCDTNIAVSSATFMHTWVQVKINGTNYVFDPSFKTYTTKTPIDIKTAMGYNRDTLLATARTGATINNDYVQNINRTGIRNTLNTYSNNLINYLRTNKPAATIDDVLGGKLLTELPAPSRDVNFETSSPVRVASYTYADMPVAAKSVLRVKYQGINQAFTSDFLYGKRLTLTFNSSNQPELRLDGTMYGAAGTAIAPGTLSTLTIAAEHNQATALSQEINMTIKSGGTFLIANGWGYSGRGITTQFRSKMDKAKAAGALETSEELKGLTLAFTGAQWLSQSSAAAYTLAKLRNSYYQPYHQLGIVGYVNNGATYVDFPAAMFNIASSDATLAARVRNMEAVNDSFNKVISVLESTTVQQVTGAPAASTVTVLDGVLGTTQKLFGAKAANYASAVQPNLTNCSAGNLSNYSNYINNNWMLLLPQNCQQSKGIWSGDAYFGFRTVGSSTVSMAKIGAFSGGLGSTYTTVFGNANNIQNKNASSFDLNVVTGQTLADPIDLTKGSFLLDHEDLNVGVGAGSQSLGFSRLYSSDNRTQNGVLGKGWDHNFNQAVSIGSDGFQGMGEDSALDAVGMLVASQVILDIAANTSQALDAEAVKIISASWLGEQLADNTVIVQQGLNGGVYVKLPNGSYNPPPGNSSKLTRNADGTYTLDTLNHAKSQFNAPTGTAVTKGKITSYTEPSGLQVKFNYNTSGQLSSVTNSLGRAITLNYTGNKISSVTDGSRTVNYVYDASENLTSYKNTLGQITTYQYDLPGRITKFFNPSFPSTAAVTNVYDSLGRVKEQTNAMGQTYLYGFAGSRSFEISPEITKVDGTKEKQLNINYVNAMGQITWERDPLGRWRQRIYDGQSRVIKQIEPEGNSIEYTYDDATCNSTEKRCTHNIKTTKLNPKAGSGLTALTTSHTYDPVTNQVASSTDAKGNVTNYTYNANGTINKVQLPADNAGVRPETTYTYVSYTPTGYPAVSLPQTVTNKINATASTVTTTTYNTANKYVPSTTVVDSGTGKLNLTNTFTYDAVGNLTKVDGPRTDVTDTVTTAFNTERLPTQVTDGLSKVTKNFYDADGRVIRTAAQLGTQWMVSCNTYSASGKLTRSWGPALLAADSSCPAAASPIEVTDYAYDEVDRQSKITEYPTATAAQNRVTQTVYNLDNTVQSIRKDVGGSLEQYYAQYLYTPNGKPQWSVDALLNAIRTNYDGFDRPASITYATAAVGSASVNPNDNETFKYDNNGNVIEQKTRSGALINSSYDKLNRLVGKTYPTEAASNITYSYDLLNHRTQSKLTNNSNTIDYVYDNAGRLTSTTSGGKAMTYQYDAAGNRIRTTWPETAFFVTSSYDALNRTKDIKETGTVNLATYAYDDLSRRTTVTLGNGTTTTLTYTPQNQLLGLAHKLASTTQDISYTYARNRIGDINTETWSNDLYQWAGTPAATTSYAKNGLNQYTTVGGVEQTYDANGNYKTDGTGWTYTYDLNNRLKSAVKTGTGAVTANLNYDAEGRLRQTAIGTATTDLLYDGTDLVAEYNGTAIARRYVHGPGVDEPLVWYEGAANTAKNWIYTNHLGSVVALANTTGASTATYTYGPYGEPNTTAGNMRFRYTGQQLLAPLNLYYYKARIYSPTLGRFLQTDPIGQKDDMNLYAYVKNNAMNSIDPTGLYQQQHYIESLWAGDAAQYYDTSVGGMVSEPGLNASIPDIYALLAVRGGVGSYGIVQESILLANAINKRDELAASFADSKWKPATVTGGYNRKTGETTAQTCGGGKCAEDHVAAALGGNKNDIKFTRAVRPRTGKEVAVCTRCEGNYGKDAFPSGTKFQSDK